MRQNLITCVLLLFFCSTVLSQDSIIFRLDLSFINPGFGYQKTTIAGNTSTGENFILNNNDNDISGFGILETDVYFYKFIGARLGVGFTHAGFDKKKIRTDFRYQFDDYDVEIPITNYEEGEVPFSGGFDMFYFQTGIIGKIKIGKWVSFCPNISYIMSTGSNASYIDADFTHLITNDQFRRKYTFDEGPFTGSKFGLDIRFVLAEIMFLGLRLEYYGLTGSGKANYKDVYDDTTEIMGLDNDYIRKINFYLIGVNVGYRIRPNGSFK